MRRVTIVTIGTFAAVLLMVSEASTQSAVSEADGQSSPTPISLPELAFCDPLLEPASQDSEEDGDDDEVQKRDHRYDQEQSEVLQSQQAIMDALYEETWDLNSGQLIPRYELCNDEQSYVVHWTQLLDISEAGDVFVAAEGAFRFMKDNDFEFVFAKRPYLGNWRLSDDLTMELQADWLNNGEIVRAPVELVQTPVEVTYASGRDESYFEEIFRVGGFRFLRVDTTVRGSFQDCAC